MIFNAFPDRKILKNQTADPLRAKLKTREALERLSNQQNSDVQPQDDAK